MKKDIDLIRELLLNIEGADKPLELGQLLEIEPDVNKLAFHFELLEHSGLIEGSITRAFGGDVVHLKINGLTMDGFNFLESIRSPQIWDKAKETIQKAVGTVTLETLAVFCNELTKKMLSTAL